MSWRGHYGAFHYLELQGGSMRFLFWPIFSQGAVEGPRIELRYNNSFTTWHLCHARENFAESLGQLPPL